MRPKGHVSGTRPAPSHGDETPVTQAQLKLLLLPWEDRKRPLPHTRGPLSAELPTPRIRRNKPTPYTHPASLPPRYDGAPKAHSMWGQDVMGRLSELSAVSHVRRCFTTAGLGDRNGGLGSGHRTQPLRPAPEPSENSTLAKRKTVDFGEVEES